MPVSRVPRFTMGLTVRRQAWVTFASYKSVQDELNAANDRHTLKSRNTTLATGYRVDKLRTAKYYVDVEKNR